MRETSYERPPSIELYSPEWFKERALASLKKISEGHWDYSDSLLLYIPGGEEAYESIQQDDDPYSNLMTKPETAYLKSIAHDVVAALPHGCDYIDLGPGTARKEQYIFDAAKKAEKQFVYRPVDISAYYLKHCAAHAAEQGIPVAPLRASFEELPEALGAPDSPRFVSLGATFMNYDPQEVIALLRNIAGPGGKAFVEAQVRDRTDMKKMADIYKGIIGVADPKLKLIGLNPETDILSRESDEGIQLWCTLKNSNEVLAAKGIEPGDKLLMFQSLRYTKEAMEEEFKKAGVSYTLLDTGAPFLGAIFNT